MQYGMKSLLLASRECAPVFELRFPAILVSSPVLLGEITERSDKVCGINLKLKAFLLASEANEEVASLEKSYKRAKCSIQ